MEIVLKGDINIWKFSGSIGNIMKIEFNQKEIL